MTFPKILWGILWFVFCKHVLNTVVMVTTFSYDTFYYVKIRDFHYFLFELTKIRNMGLK